MQLYVKSAAMILLMAAAVKTIGLFHPSAFLQRRDAIFFFLTNFELVCAVAVFEVVVAAAVLGLRNYDLSRKVLWVLWLALLFCIYRTGISLAGDPRPCKCFGDLFGWLAVPEPMTKKFSMAVLVYLALPSALWTLLERTVPLFRADGHSTAIKQPPILCQLT